MRDYDRKSINTGQAKPVGARRENIAKRRDAPEVEPYARIGLIRICAGVRAVTGVPTANRSAIGVTSVYPSISDMNSRRGERSKGQFPTWWPS